MAAGASAEVSTLVLVTPAERVRIRLAAEREARAPFDQAWERAIAQVPHNLANVSRAEWMLALDWARPVFERAYQREDAGPEELAVSRMQELAAA